MARGETPIDHCLCSVYLLCFPLYVSIDMSKRINVLKIPISSLRQSRPKWSIESRAAYHQYVQILLAWKKNHFQNQINLETLVFYSPRMREIIKSAITIAVWMCFFFLHRNHGCSRHRHHRRHRRHYDRAFFFTISQMLCMYFRLYIIIIHPLAGIIINECVYACLRQVCI